MGLTRYDMLYLAALPALAPYLAWRRLARGKYSESAAGMLGRHLPAGDEARRFAAGSLWIHAVSVGEVAAARAVAGGLAQLCPELQLLISTVTETGQAAARRSFPEAAVTYFPVDWSSNARRFQAAFNPRVFVLMETELWPNFLTLAAARGTKVFMLNAKLSDRSFPRYRRARGYLAPALAALRGVCAQTDEDARRFVGLGIPAERVRATGNCKFDLPAAEMTGAVREALAAELGLAPGRRWIVAGSTHPGEEEMILGAFREVLREEPRAGLLLCPRHPDRFGEAEVLARAAGFRVARSSAGGVDAAAEVVVLDRMGVLARAYGLGEIAIVAGSFCKVGGHNLLEAAAHGVPVVHGPDMHSQREIARIFSEAGAGVRVTGGELAPALLRLLRDDEARRAEGARGLAALRLNQGSAARAVAAVGEWLEP